MMRERLLVAVLVGAVSACGGGEAPPTASPKPPAPAPTTTTVVAVTSTTAAEAAATPPGPRAVPAVEVRENADLVSFSNWRWKDAAQEQLAVEVRLLKGPVNQIRYDFYAGDKYVTSGAIPGRLFSAPGDTQTSYLPPVTGVRSGGKPLIADVSRATRLVLNVDTVPTDAVPAGQPPWVAASATACEQGSAADCQVLATAFRTGKAEAGRVKPDPALAERFSKRFVRIGESACARGASDACFLLGTAYHTGEDAVANPERGEALIQKACGAEYEQACAWLRQQATTR